jgi:hypothetical protein
MITPSRVGNRLLEPQSCLINWPIAVDLVAQLEAVAHLVRDEACHD